MKRHLVSHPVRFGALLAVAAIGVGVLTSLSSVEAQARPRGTGESSLIGVRLFASGTDLIRRFGSPDDVLPITVSAQQPGGGPAGGNAPGPAGGGDPRMGGGGGGEVSGMWNPDDFIGNPPTADNRQKGPGGGEGGGSNLVMAGSGGGGGNQSNAPGAGSSVGESTTGVAVTFTRWVYRRGTSRYSFVLDRFNRIVQIEAVGLKDSRVRTRRGLSFGSTFGEVIRRHGAPDAYDISGSNIMMRYLSRDKVAYRLSRLGANRPHQITGIVVSAGKP